MKITHLNKSKIYWPKKLKPAFSTNIITDNKTTSDGNIENVSEINAIEAREWVDDNKK